MNEDLNTSLDAPLNTPLDAPLNTPLDPSLDEVKPNVNPFEIQPAGTPESIPDPEVPEVSFGKAVNAAVEQQWIVGPDEVEFGFKSYAADPNFRWTPELTNELTKDIPEQLWGAFDDAGSEEHARAIRDELLSDIENQKTLENVSGGWAYQLGAAILDPTAIGITTGTSGLGAAAVAGTKLSKLGKFLTMLGVNVSTDLAIEGAVVANDATQSWDNLVFAGLASAGLNSAILAKQLRGGKGVSRIDEDALQAGVDTNPEFRDLMGTKDFWNEDLTPAARADLNDRMARIYEEEAAKLRRNPLTPEEIGRTAADGESGQEVLSDSAGSMRASQYEPISENAEDLLSDLQGAPRTSYGAARLDVVGKLKSSEHPIFRELGARLAEDALGNADNSVNRFGASEFQSRLFRTMDTDVQRTVSPAYREWATEQGIGPFGKWFYKERETFMREVYAYVTQEGTDAALGRHWHPSVARAGDAYRSAYAKYLAEAKKAGVKGFDEVDINPNYMPRFFDHERIAELNRVFGSENVRNLIAGAFRSANRAVTEQQAKKFARAYLDKVRSVGANVDMGVTRGLTGDDANGLVEMLKDAVDLDAADIEAMVSHLRISREGGHTRSKRRALFDDGYSVTLKRADNSGEQRIGITELFNTNAEHVFDLYNRQLSGAVALGKAGFNSPAQVQDMINKARATAGDIPNYTKVDRDAELTEFLLNSITGRPNALQGGQDARFTTTGRTLSMLRDFNFLRLMGNLGLAQIPEAGRVLGELGWRNSLKALPALRGIMRDMKTGKLSNELLDEFEGIVGTGSEYLTSTIYNRVGVRLEGDDFTTQGISQRVGRMETRMAHAKRVMTQVSGMMPVNTVLYRWTSAAMAHRWVNLATGAETISAKRLAWMGLSEDMHERIVKQIRKHSDYEASELGRASKVRKLNIDQWDDVDAAEAFAMASHRLSRNVIQANDPGTLPKWVSDSPLMQTIWQFRSFMWGSWSKQTLHGIKMRDFPAVSAFMAATVLGGMTHAFRAYMVSLGMSEDRREEYLKTQLGAGGIAAGAFLRAGQSSIIPMVVDTFMDLAGQGPFAGYRGSGLASGIFGNPTWDLINTAPQQIRGAVVDNQSEAAARRSLSLLPFQNVIGLQQALNAMAAQIGN